MTAWWICSCKYTCLLLVIPPFFEKFLRHALITHWPLLLSFGCFGFCVSRVGSIYGTLPWRNILVLSFRLGPRVELFYSIFKLCVRSRVRGCVVVCCGGGWACQCVWLRAYAFALKAPRGHYGEQNGAEGRTSQRTGMLKSTLISQQKSCWLTVIARWWSWYSQSADDGATTQLPHGLAPKMDGAEAMWLLINYVCFVM